MKKLIGLVIVLMVATSGTASSAPTQVTARTYPDSISGPGGPVMKCWAQLKASGNSDDMSCFDALPHTTRVYYVGE